jgi:[ribosomal protein S5]-alanine N-acetyltransferase
MYLTKAQTERLLIRPLNQEDAKSWARFFIDNESMKFFAFDPALSPEEKAGDWIEKQLLRYRENRYGLMALTDILTGELVGQCGLLTQEINNKSELEIGYHIMPEHWGKGLATEAARYFKSFAFGNDLTDTLISIIHVDNIRSQRVAEKNGMERTIRADFRGLPVYIYRIGKPAAG